MPLSKATLDTSSLHYALYGNNKHLSNLLHDTPLPYRAAWLPWFYKLNDAAEQPSYHWHFFDSSSQPNNKVLPQNDKENGSEYETIKAAHCEHLIAEAILKELAQHSSQLIPALTVADPLSGTTTFIWSPSSLGEFKSLCQLLRSKLLSITAYNLEMGLEKLTVLPAINFVFAMDIDPPNNHWHSDAYFKFMQLREHLTLDMGRAYPSINLRWVSLRAESHAQTLHAALLVDHGPAPDWDEEIRNTTKSPYARSAQSTAADTWMNDFLNNDTNSALQGSNFVQLADSLRQADQPAAGTNNATSKATDKTIQPPPELLESWIQVRQWQDSGIHVRFAPCTLISADNASGKSTLIEALYQASFNFPRPRVNMPLEATNWQNRIFIQDDSPPTVNILYYHQPNQDNPADKIDNPAMCLGAIFGTDVDVASELSGELHLITLLAVKPEFVIQEILPEITSLRRVAGIIDNALIPIPNKELEDFTTAAIIRYFEQVGQAPNHADGASALSFDLGTSNWFRAKAAQVSEDRTNPAAAAGASLIKDKGPQRPSTNMQSLYEMLAAYLYEEMSTENSRQGGRWHDALDLLAETLTSGNAAVTIEDTVIQILLRGLRKLFSDKLTDVNNFVEDEALPMETPKFGRLQNALISFLNPSGDGELHTYNGSDIRPNTAALVQKGQAQRLARHLYFSKNVWLPMILEDVTIGQDVTAAARTISRFMTIARKQQAILWARARTTPRHTVNRSAVIQHHWSDIDDLHSNHENRRLPLSTKEAAGYPSSAAPSAQLVLTSYQVRAIEQVASVEGVMPARHRNALRMLIPEVCLNTIVLAVQRCIEIHRQHRREIETNLGTHAIEQLTSFSGQSVPSAIVRLHWAQVRPTFPIIPTWHGQVKYLQNVFYQLELMGLSRLGLTLRNELKQNGVSPQDFKECEKLADNTIYTTTHLPCEIEYSSAHIVTVIADWLAANDLLPAMFSDQETNFFTDSLSTLVLRSSEHQVDSVGPLRAQRITAFCQQLAPITVSLNSPPATNTDHEPTTEADNATTISPPNTSESAENNITHATNETSSATTSTHQSPSASVTLDPSPAPDHVPSNTVAQNTNSEHLPGTEKHSTNPTPDSTSRSLASDNPGNASEDPQTNQHNQSSENTKPDTDSDPSTQQDNTEISENERDPESTDSTANERQPLSADKNLEKDTTINNHTAKQCSKDDTLRILIASYKFTSDEDSADLVISHNLSELPINEFVASARTNILDAVPQRCNQYVIHTPYHAQANIELQLPLHNSLAIAVGSFFHHRCTRSVAAWQGRRFDSPGVLWTLDRTDSTVPSAIKLQQYSHHAGDNPAKAPELHVLISITGSVIQQWEKWKTEQAAIAEKEARTYFAPRYIELNIGDLAIDSGQHAVAAADHTARYIVAHRPLSSPAIRLFINAPMSYCVALGRTLRGMGMIHVMEFYKNEQRYFLAHTLNL